MFPTAYCLYWMERSMAGVLQYVGVFLIIYLAIWLSMYLSYRRRIRQINRPAARRGRRVLTHRGFTGAVRCGRLNQKVFREVRLCANASGAGMR